MSSCAYCGRENDGNASHCRDCGSDLRPVSAQDATPRGMSPQAALVFARFGPPVLVFVCVVMAVDVARSSFDSIGFFLCLGSPVVLGLGIWIARAWSRAELARVERVITGVALFPALVFLGLVSLWVIPMILIGGIGPR